MRRVVPEVRVSPGATGTDDVGRHVSKLSSHGLDARLALGDGRALLLLGISPHNSVRARRAARDVHVVYLDQESSDALARGVGRQDLDEAIADHVTEEGSDIGVGARA